MLLNSVNYFFGNLLKIIWKVTGKVRGQPFNELNIFKVMHLVIKNKV